MHRVEAVNEHSDTDDPNGDGEGVWSPDIEYFFHQALAMFPPCGRRKHILPEEGGKMFGRNELIARHIFTNTGKIRTRKQVSSHIQVLARRKAKAEATNNGGGSTAGSVSPASSMGMGGSDGSNNRLSRPDSATGVLGGPPQFQLAPAGQHRNQQQHNPINNHFQPSEATINCFHDVWNNRPIVTQKIRLVEFSAFIEYRPDATKVVPNTPRFPGQQVGLSCLESIPIASPTLHGLGTAPISTDRAQAMSSYGISSLTSNGSSTPQSPQLTTDPCQQTHFNFHHKQPLNDNQQHQNHQLNEPIDNSLQEHNNGLLDYTQIQARQSQSSTRFTRYSYIKIDYRQPMRAHTSNLERIDIGQVQDKFPEIGGSDGLFQRGPSDAFFLVKFWSDFNNDQEFNVVDQNSYLGFSSHFETIDPYKNITCSTKACSYGHQVVEKVEKIYGTFNNLNGRYSYDIDRSPLCEFMIQFIKKLRQLPMVSQMNSVLENFTVLQVVTSESSSDILLCLAYVFEIASSGQNRGGSQYHVYKLTKD